MVVKAYWTSVVQGEDRNKLLNVIVFRSRGGRISDYLLVAAKIRSLRRWPRRVVRIEERYEIKVSELSKVTYKTEYEEKIKQRWERVRGEVTGGVD